MTVALGSPPPGGLSEAAAIAAAVAAAPVSSSIPFKALRTESGPYGIVGPGDAGLDADHWVWSVTLAGQFSVPGCEASGQPACPLVGTTLVVIDYVTGAFVIAETPG
jgi:hypothetical protein